MNKTTDKVKFGIRQKLFFLVLFGFSALIIVTSWRIGVEANQAANATIERTLSQSSQILRTKVLSRFVSIKETAVGIARDGRVLPLIYDVDAPTLQDLSYEFQKVLSFDILFFTDNRGVVLARSDRPEAVGQVLAGKSSVFDMALGGEFGQGIIVSQGKLLQIVVAPVFDNVAQDLVRGTVAVAYELSPEIAREIHALTASDIGFFTFSRASNGDIISANSSYNTNAGLTTELDRYFQEHPDDWQKISRSQEQQVNFHLSLAEEDFFAIAMPLANHDGENLGFIMALTSRTELLMPFIKVQQQVYWVGFICVIIASIIAWVIAKRISSPIVALVSVAKNIQEGKYPDVSERKQLNDEVGLLYDAVFQMGNTLKEKAELESYLAHLSEDLDSEGLTLLDDMPVDEPPDLPVVAAPVDEQSVGEYTEIRETDLIQDTQYPAAVNEPVHRLMDDGLIVHERYQVLRHLGAGAMADVYLAKDLELGESIALKVLEKASFSEQELEQVKQEIRLARRITHRNILRTYDFGVWNGRYYITMEFVHGYDLSRLLEKAGALSISIGLTMARQICSAIKAAHDQGIIHRDLKPSNMMINKQGIIKIMDFGLALNVGKENKLLAEGSSKQKESVIAGTPKYMAPEQFLGRGLDQRTDIYALGIILYAIFTGKPPFGHAKNFEQLEELHLQTVPPGLRSILPSIPLALDGIVSKAIAKKPADRFQSVTELLEALQAVSSSSV